MKARARQALAALLAALGAAALASCKQDPKREQAFAQLRARGAGERAKAVREIAAAAGARDAQAWSALSRAARDPSAQVRQAAAAALAGAPKAGALPPLDEGGPPDPDDVLGGLLSDPQDEVRLAASAALGRRCGPRSKGYLTSGFGRSGTAVRGAIVAALGKCGAAPREALQHEEQRRRERALRLLEAPSAAQRAQGALELGLLGRDEDARTLLPLLDERDGVVVAAGARALGRAGALQAEPRLRALLGEEASVLAAAAAEGLAALGPQAVHRSQAELIAVAARPDPEAEAAALALAGADAQARDLCAAAAQAREARAAEVLAAAGRCEAGALSTALAQAVRGSGALSRDEQQRASALVAALLGAPAGHSAAAAAPLSRLIERADPELALQAARAAARLGAAGAGPALIAVVRRERKALQDERSRPHRPAVAQDDAEAAEVGRQAMRAPAPDRKKYDALMAKLQKRDQAQTARAGASVRLAEILRGAQPGERRSLLAGALRAALALRAPGAEAEARSLATDPLPDVAAAARGEPEPAALPEDPASCLPTSGAVAAPGCLARVEATPLQGDGAARALAAARLGLWSDDGRDRAAACTLLRRLDERASAPARALLADDPERRVRLSCDERAARNLTDPAQPR
jgi:hypothetical protein